MIRTNSQITKKTYTTGTKIKRRISKVGSKHQYEKKQNFCIGEETSHLKLDKNETTSGEVDKNK